MLWNIKGAEIVFEHERLVKCEGLNILAERMKALDPDENGTNIFLGVEQAERIKLKERSQRQGGSPHNLTPSLLVPDWSHQQLGFKKDMAIASLNINGLRSHLDEVQLLIRNLGIHIIALNETKLNPEFPKELTCVASYQQERLERTCNGGGVSIYIRDSIKYKRRPDIPSHDLELICIDVEPPKSESFLVLAWYRPPSDTVGSFNKLEKVLSFLDKEGKEIILLGDTNCDLTPKQAEQPIDNNSKHMLDVYELFSFKQRIDRPTRVTLTTSIIDHIATKRARNIVKPEFMKFL